MPLADGYNYTNETLGAVNLTFTETTIQQQIGHTIGTNKSPTVLRQHILDIENRNHTPILSASAKLSNELRRPANEAENRSAQSAAEKQSKDMRRINSASIIPVNHDFHSFVDRVVKDALGFFDETNNEALIQASVAQISKVCQKPPDTLPQNVPKRIRANKLFEFACHKDSNLGKTSLKYGIDHIRLHRDFINLADSSEFEQLLGQIEDSPGADMIVSIPCTVYSQWQCMSISRHGPKYLAKLLKRKSEQLVLLKHALIAADMIIANGGRIAFEWP